VPLVLGLEAQAVASRWEGESDEADVLTAGEEEDPGTAAEDAGPPTAGGVT